MMWKRLTLSGHIYQNDTEAISIDRTSRSGVLLSFTSKASFAAAGAQVCNLTDSFTHYSNPPEFMCCRVTCLGSCSIAREGLISKVSMQSSTLLGHGHPYTEADIWSLKVSRRLQASMIHLDVGSIESYFDGVCDAACETPPSQRDQRDGLGTGGLVICSSIMRQRVAQYGGPHWNIKARS